MQFTKDICALKKIKLIKWEVENTNEKAIHFYEKLGADLINKSFTKWRIG